MRNIFATPAPITEAELEIEKKAIKAERDRDQDREDRVEALNRLAAVRAIPRQYQERKDQLRAQGCWLVEDYWPEALVAMNRQPAIGRPILYVERWPFEIRADGIYAKRRDPVEGVHVICEKMCSPFLPVKNYDRGRSSAVVLSDGKWRVIDFSADLVDTKNALAAAGVEFSTRYFGSASPHIRQGTQAIPVVSMLAYYVDGAVREA